MTSSLLCYLITTGPPETPSILPGWGGNWDGDLDVVGNSDGVKFSDFDERRMRRMITGAGELEERWSRLRRRRPTATISDLRSQFFHRHLW